MKKDFFKELERLCNIYLDYINDFDNSKRIYEFMLNNKK